MSLEYGMLKIIEYAIIKLLIVDFIKKKLLKMFNFILKNLYLEY